LKRNLTIFTTFLLATGKNNIFKQHKHSSNGNQKYKHRSVLRLGALSEETGVIYQSPSPISSARKITVEGKESILTFKRDRQLQYKRNIEERSRNHYCRGKAICITQFVCVCVCVALLIHHYIVICGPTILQYFPTFSYKRHDCRQKKRLLIIKCVFDFLYNFCLKVSHSKRNERDMFRNIYSFSCITSVILVNFKVIWVFSTNFRKILTY